jgi:hypothetical protein
MIVGLVRPIRRAMNRDSLVDQLARRLKSATIIAGIDQNPDVIAPRPAASQKLTRPVGMIENDLRVMRGAPAEFRVELNKRHKSLIGF